MMGFLNFTANEARVPAGTVAFFAGENIPSGWLLADGRYVKKDDYAALYAALGSIYGEAPEGYFRLPDARGLFLRGLDSDRFVPTSDTELVDGKTYYTEEGKEITSLSNESIATYYEKADGYDPGRKLGSFQEATMATSYSSVGQHLTMFKNYDTGDMDSVQKVRMASSTTLKDMPMYYYDVAMRPFNLALNVMIKT